jgi:hypothetical protein
MKSRFMYKEEMMNCTDRHCNAGAAAHRFRVWNVILIMAKAMAHSSGEDPLRKHHKPLSVFSRFLSQPSMSSSEFYQSPTIAPKANATGLRLEATNRGDSSRGTATFIAFAVVILFGFFFAFILCQCRGHQCQKRSGGKDVPPEDKENNVLTDKTATHDSMECNMNDSVDSIQEQGASVQQNLETDSPNKVLLTAAKEIHDDVSTGSDSSSDLFDERWNGKTEASNIAIRISEGDEDSGHSSRNELCGPIDLDNGCNFKDSDPPPTSSRSPSQSLQHVSHPRKLAVIKRKKKTSAVIVNGIRDIRAQEKSAGRLCPIPEIAHGDDDSISLSTNHSHPRTNPPPLVDHSGSQDHKLKRYV